MSYRLYVAYQALKSYAVTMLIIDVLIALYKARVMGA
jgi:hypothetical protein